MGGVHRLAAVFRAPLQIPSIVTGIAFLQVFYLVGDATGFYWNGTFAGLLVGHAFVATPYVVGSVTAILQRFDTRLEEAAASLGAGRWRTFRRVTLPVVAPGIVSSLLVGFTVSFDEFIMAFFLTGTEPTLPVYIWSQVRFPAKLPIVLALGTLLILASLALLLAAEYFRRRSLRLSAVQEGVPIA